MPKFTNPGDSLEGEKIIVGGRKIMPAGGPTADKVTGRTRWHVSIKSGAKARITKAHDPLVAKFRPASHLQVGDELDGNHLEGASEQHFRSDDKNVGGRRTSRHPGQSFEMKGNCLVAIVKDYLQQTEPPKNVKDVASLSQAQAPAKQLPPAPTKLIQ